MTVVVIGAGLAGLTAAADLVANGIEVVVLEARDRVGGRTHGIEVAPGAWVDAGAAYLGVRHTALLGLIEKLGLSTTPTSMSGDSRFALGAEPVRSSGRFPPLSAVALGDMFDLLDELAKSLRVDAPWLSPDAARLDAMSTAQWAEQNLKHPDARLFFPLFLGEMMAADPKDISVLHMAFYLRSGGGIRYLNAFEGGAQEARVAHGAHRLCDELAARLGSRVFLGHPVHAIHQHGDIVNVYSGGETFQASAAVVALPPLLANEIDYLPVLNTPRAGRDTKPGCVVKVHLIFPSPVWRDHGLSGWSVSATGPMLSTVDDSPADHGVGVLTGFITGYEAHRFSALPESEQRYEVMAQLRRLFPQLPEPNAYHATDWLNADFSRGCYAALFGPGDWMRQGPHLTRAHGRIHWAGTETSTEFFGLMEGAIRSGHRVAAELTALFQSDCADKPLLRCGV
jgi:monoamine oxidase